MRYFKYDDSHKIRFTDSYTNGGGMIVSANGKRYITLQAFEISDDYAGIPSAYAVPLGQNPHTFGECLKCVEIYDHGGVYSAVPSRAWYDFGINGIIF